jgi:hypothetical protein
MKQALNISNKPDHLSVDEWIEDITAKFGNNIDYNQVDKYYAGLKKPKSNTEYSERMKGWKK